MCVYLLCFFLVALPSRPGVPSTSTSRGRERVSPTNPHVEPQSACSQVQDDEDEEVIGDGEMVYQRQVASSLFSAKPLSPQPGLDPGCLPSSLESSLPESEARLIRKARKVMMYVTGRAGIPLYFFSSCLPVSPSDFSVAAESLFLSLFVTFSPVVRW